MLARSLTLASLLGLSSGGLAHAQDATSLSDTAVATPAPTPPGLTLPAHFVAVSVALQSDLTKGAAGDSVSVAPDLAFGLTDDLTVALVHTMANSTGFWSGRTTGSLCVSGQACSDLYSTGALLAKLELTRGRLAIAALGGLIYNVDPFRLGAGAGAEALLRVGALGVHVKPTIYIGLDDREGTPTAAPNKEFVNLPLSLLVPATASLQLGLQSGVAGPLEGFAASYRIPVAAMATYAATSSMSAGVAVSFDRVAGGGEPMTTGALDARSLTVTLGWVK